MQQSRAPRQIESSERSLIFVHVVTFNNESTIVRCLDSVISQEGFELGNDLFVFVTDNQSRDNTAQTVLGHFGDQIQLKKNKINTGFTGAHNSGIAFALSHNADYVLLLNPDAQLAPNALQQLVDALSSDSRAGMACPRLLRSDEHLEPLLPRTLDSAGMFITPAIRHFDRGSNEKDNGKYDRDEYVFGASGAAVLLKRDFILDAALHNDDKTAPLRLFDGTFFAYREDADLAWRAQWLGWKCRYVSGAIGYHQRLVLPERRHLLPAELNAYSVRNRFLLQLNNFSFLANLHCLPALAWRNALVIAAVSIYERSSFPALRAAFHLAPQALRHRRKLLEKRRVAAYEVSRWFRFRPHSEPALREQLTGRPVRSLLIVIVNYNSGSRLTNCLLNLAPEIYEMVGRLEITIRVIDNASSDDSAKRAEPMFRNARKIEFIFADKNLGFAGAINAAAENNTADAVLVLNPDVTVCAKSIVELTRVLDEYATVGAVAPVLYGEDRKVQHGFTVREFPTLGSTLAELFGIHRLFPQNRWSRQYSLSDDSFVAAYLEQSTPQHGTPHESPEKPLLVSQPAGACLMIRRQAFDAVKGFDKSFWPAWFEDVDFCKRLGNAGYHCAVQAKATADHEGGYSLKTLAPGRFSEIWYPNLLNYWKKQGHLGEFVTIRLLLPLALVVRSVVSCIDAIFAAIRDGGRGREKLILSKTLLRLALSPRGPKRP